MNEGRYIELQVAFIRALQAKDMSTAWNLSKEMEFHFPDHPIHNHFRQLIEEHATLRATRSDGGQAPHAVSTDDNDDEDDDEDDDDSHQHEGGSSDEDEDEQGAVTHSPNTVVDGVVVDYMPPNLQQRQQQKQQQQVQAKPHSSSSQPSYAAAIPVSQPTVAVQPQQQQQIPTPAPTNYQVPQPAHLPIQQQQEAMYEIDETIEKMMDSWDTASDAEIAKQLQRLGIMQTASSLKR